MIELLPCAMFANGPAWTNTGVFSTVCIRVGLIASFSSTAIAPAVRSSSAVTALPSWSRADDDPPESLAQVPEARGEREDRHQLAGHGDVEARLAR